jgi:N-acetylated-alpha-linked acidic dipeptidase
MIRLRPAGELFFFTAALTLLLGPKPGSAQGTAPATVFGYTDFAQQAKWDAAFLAIPDAKLAGEHLKTLTAKPHWASSPEDFETAQYVAAKFRAAGLETEIVPYRVWLNKPVKIEITAVDAHGKQLMSGPSPEHVDPNAYGGDPFQDAKNILPAFNSSSPSGDVTATVVYANHGTVEDFDKLAKLGVSVKGKIVIVRYGANFRGVKVYIAQQRGAAGVLIYSDPDDDGYSRGDMYPRGPYRPASGVQRGSVQLLTLYPGDPETPGIASTPDLPDTSRITDPAKMNQPSIPSNPLSYEDASPILAHLDGANVPHAWQGALPFAYHVGGTGAVVVHMHLEQDYKLRTIWDVIGKVHGEDDSAWVVAGNHRDAWVFGAVDPNSGTAAMLETVHGIGALLQQGWKPKRTIVFASWDAEEEGLIGSTEWTEQHAAELAHAVAYFNTDVGVSGPSFNAAAVPSLKRFLREVTTEVPSPKGGTVYDQWLADQQGDERSGDQSRTSQEQNAQKKGAQKEQEEVRIGTLGSGSDFTPFLQHLGVPSTDMGSDGPYGVYHSAFDNYNWFVKFADPTFVYEQQQARVFGLEVLHMADADILPYDYAEYAAGIVDYVKAAQQRAQRLRIKLDFSAATAASNRFLTAGKAALARQTSDTVELPVTHAKTMLEAYPATAKLNVDLRDVETAMLGAGLPHRPWYRHVIYAPGEYTGYSAVVIPGVNEGLDVKDEARTQAQLDELAKALNRGSSILELAAK